MLSLVIVGAGGLGRVTQELALRDPDFDVVWRIGGFLDTRPDALKGYDVGVPLLGDPRTYQPKPQEIYIPAVGDTRLKKELIAPLVTKGAVFVPLRPSCHIGARCKWGASVLGDNAKISVDVTIGDYVYVDGDALISHDVVIGDYVHIGARAFIGGKVKIGPLVTVHPMAVVMMDAQIGEGCVIGAGAVVSGRVPPHTTMMGNPARKFTFRAD
jgi:sugar O-acyltransferase (sialic acid O-acetyltransferase NeuD family)